MAGVHPKSGAALPDLRRATGLGANCVYSFGVFWTLLDCFEPLSGLLLASARPQDIGRVMKVFNSSMFWRRRWRRVAMFAFSCDSSLLVAVQMCRRVSETV